jgi:phosphopantothenoylcysteine decarboxylase/phosphopantothenate--cysteine ligase
MGGDRNTVHLVTRDGVEDWPSQSKEEVARELVERIIQTLGLNKPGAKTRGGASR